MSELRRIVATLAVGAAHLALIIALWRSTWHRMAVAESPFFTLPIMLAEDQMPEAALVQKRSSTQAAEPAPRHASAARKPATARPRVEKSPEESLRTGGAQTGAATLGQKVAIPTSPEIDPTPPVDWHAEASATADAMVRRDSVVESDRSSLAARWFVGSTTGATCRS